MHYTFRGANDAFRGLLESIHYPRAVPQGLMTRHTKSRAGDVIQVDESVLVTYTHPRERVLFNQARDANCFFHLYESLWMLAGRNDVAPLAYYNSRIGEVASDDGQTFNGAYGYRWRNATEYEDSYGDGCYPKTVDQLKIIIDQLKRKPESRRCVLQMWNVEDDLLKIDQTKDVCCNVCAFFSIRPDPTHDCTGYPIPYGNDEGPGMMKPRQSYLDMTVVNRSNDMIWGMLGANVVHFSLLLEYMAACIGVEVGVYNQFTNNLHAYTDRWKPEEWLADKTPVCYDLPGYHSVPLVKDPTTFDREVVQFIAMGQEACLHNWAEPFLQKVAAPMSWAFRLHKEHRDYRSALNTMNLVAAEDWKIAGTNWLLKRQALWEKKHEASIN